MNRQALWRLYLKLGKQVHRAVDLSKTALSNLTLVEAANAIANGSVTTVTLTEAALDAFKIWNPSINATIWLDGKALERAAATMQSGRQARPWVLCAGIPLAHKDMYYKMESYLPVALRCGQILDRISQQRSLTVYTRQARSRLVV